MNKDRALIIKTTVVKLYTKIGSNDCTAKVIIMNGEGWYFQLAVSTMLIKEFMETQM